MYIIYLHTENKRLYLQSQLTYKHNTFSNKQHETRKKSTKKDQTYT